MKRNRKVMLMGCALGFLGLTSCTDGYEAEPVENFTIDYVFSTTDSVGKQAVQHLRNIYRHLESGHGRINNAYLDAATDDAMSIYFDEHNAYKLLMGRYTANSRVSDMDWDIYYQTIREATIHIANIDRVPFNLTYVKGDEVADEEGKYAEYPLNATMKSEARFLRAFAYFELVKRYGGVPLLGERVFELDDDLEIPRNTFAECVDFIVSELDRAKGDLRGTPMHDQDATNYAFVATREACDALKCRVLLYAASKLFNEAPLERGNELVGYASYDVNRWKLAADAAMEFMEKYGHKGTGVFDLNNDFRKVFISNYSASNPEIIWAHRGDLSSTSIERNNGPLGFTANAQGNGYTLPTQNLVDAFLMKDGKLPGESKYPYSTGADQYNNRDKRFECTVLHNGSNWLGRQLATYEGGGNNPTNASLYTRTSYYMCKFMDDYSSGKTEYSSTPHPWIYFRYAEILLNYAEAMNEFAGPDAPDVIDCIIKLRQRAGIEPGADRRYGIKEGISQDEMRQLIYNERRIEMAFEEQRYYDIRRWKIGNEVYAQPVRGLSITNRDGILVYTVRDLINVNWDDRRCLYPIPYSEVLKNSNMVQNPNW